MTAFTAEDFAQANLATKGKFGVARRTDPRDTHQWLAHVGGQGWFSDEEMARCGWVPVREASGKREPWADLADVLKAWDAGESALDVDVKRMARWLHERGVRAVTAALEGEQ